ncbi:MAG: hypothetical protein HN613_06210 [Gammaproteobacteria bacterium]|jgi:hypothetical protein|nr:hypothetical protein [Gammaproteobacteria bacterium]MBT7604046.1 hypothetical protein [Gammaproteobacteria bacterium]
MNNLKLSFSSFKLHYFLLFVPAFFMIVWHIIDNSLPGSDGGQFFFGSVSLYENLFLERDNFFESITRYISDIICCRGIKPSLFPALGSPFVILSLGNWNAAFALMGIFYVSLITVFAYLIVFEFTGKKYYSALSAIIVGTLPAVFANAVANVAEIGLIAFLLPAFYFLYKSDHFSVANHSKYFAIFMTLAISVRPVQALIILLLPIIITLWRGRIKNIFTSQQLITISYLLILFLCILLYVPYLRNFGEPLYIHLTRSNFPAYNISIVTDVYINLTIFFTFLFTLFTTLLLYKNQFHALRKELSFKFKNCKNYILQIFLLIFVLNIIIWSLLFHNFFYWVFAATFGTLLDAGNWNLASDNSSDTFITLVLGSIKYNAFYAFYFSLISLFLMSLLNQIIPKQKIFIYVLASALIFPVLTLLSTQAAVVRFVPAIVICMIILLILLGSFKKYSRLPVFLVLSFMLFKSFVFFDYSLNFKFVNHDFYSFAKNKYTPNFPTGFSQEKVESTKDVGLYTLDLLSKYHRKYNFKKAYVDGTSKLTGKYGVDQFKVNNIAIFKNTPFLVGDVDVRNYEKNSYQMAANNGFDFMFLVNPLIHDDGSQKYKDDLEFHYNCNHVTAPCNISPGSLKSFKMILDFVRMINDGSISKTKWELVETIKHYNYDVFILKIKK